MHECPRCDGACYCDVEDHYQPAPRDCRHACEDEFYPDDEEEVNTMTEPNTTAPDPNPPQETSGETAGTPTDAPSDSSGDTKPE